MIPKNLEEVCDLFDCRICEDLDYQTEKAVYYLGEDGDLAVGILPFVLTPGFPTKRLLRSFVESEEGVDHINEAAADNFVEWDEELQEWWDDEEQD